MTITEFAILPFKSPPNFSDLTLQSLFQKLSAWQSECSSFPLCFFTNAGEPLAHSEIYLVTGWTNIAAHEAWIRGERNQALLQAFVPYADVQRVRMVHVDVDFEAVFRVAACSDGTMVVERYDGARLEASTSFEGEGKKRDTLSLVGRDLARYDGDVFRFVCSAESKVEGVALVERWALKRTYDVVGHI